MPYLHSNSHLRPGNDSYHATVPHAPLPSTQLIDPHHVPHNHTSTTAEHDSVRPLTRDHTMDEFAQTRAPDDLFDEDFTPVAQPPPRSSGHSSGPRGGGGARGAARGRGTGDGSGNDNGNGQRQPDGLQRHGSESSVPSPEQRGVPTGPKETQPPRVEAVKGDRSGTGGVKQVRLLSSPLTAHYTLHTPRACFTAPDVYSL